MHFEFIQCHHDLPTASSSPLRDNLTGMRSVNKALSRPAAQLMPLISISPPLHRSTKSAAATVVRGSIAIRQHQPERTVPPPLPHEGDLPPPRWAEWRKWIWSQSRSFFDRQERGDPALTFVSSALPKLGRPFLGRLSKENHPAVLHTDAVGLPSESALLSPHPDGVEPL